MLYPQTGPLQRTDHFPSFTALLRPRERLDRGHSLVQAGVGLSGVVLRVVAGGGSSAGLIHMHDVISADLRVPEQFVDQVLPALFLSLSRQLFLVRNRFFGHVVSRMQGVL